MLIHASKFKNFLITCRDSLRYGLQHFLWYIIGITLTDIMGACLRFVQIGTLGYIINELISLSETTSDTTMLYYYVFLYVGASLIPLILNSISGYLDTIFFIKFTNFIKIKRRLHVANLDIQTLESSEFQNIHTKVREKGDWGTYLVISDVINILVYVIVAMIAITMLGAFDWRIALIAIITIIPAFMIDIVIGERSYGIWDEDTNERRLHDHHNDLLGIKQNIIDLRLLGAVSFIAEKINNFSHRFEKKTVKLERRRLMGEIGSVLFEGFGIGIVLYIVVTAVLHKEIGIGELSIILGIFAQLQANFSSIFKRLASLNKNILYAKDQVDLFNIKHVLQHSKNPVTIINNKPLSFEFRNVSFAYPGQSKNVFDNLSFRVDEGSKVAIVGHNGAGKTTLVQLLLRIYDVKSGVILINGIDIKNLNIDEYYRSVSVILQEIPYYKLKVNESIGLGKSHEDINATQIKTAAEKAKAHDFISSWDAGYDTQIGSDFEGKELSGGEKQRVALARALYRSAGLVILDEPTSAVDAIAEQEIFETLYHDLKNSTVITISHRFSTVKKSDTIIMLEHGVLVEQGSHNELLAMGGKYAQLYNAQANAYII